MKNSTIKYIAIILFTILYACNVNALEISSNEYTIYMNGEIVKGDFDKFIKVLSKRKELPNYITIQSPGGNVYEATKIGTFIREAALGVSVDKACGSSCFFILVAGVDRYINDSIIAIHRPYYEKDYFSGLSLSSAEKKYRELEYRSRNYLKAMGVPTAIVEKMFFMASDEAHNLTPSERKFLSKRSFAYDEWVKAKCIPLSINERADYNPFHQFDETPEKNYASKGYYEYLKNKYKKYDECVKSLKKSERTSALNNHLKSQSEMPNN